ncbi:hypothetical protein TNCV_4027611 [Trichonephila clavipes]|nr:hypothetical protein TNCV_4027611 [Trichonephila clavipes]
MNPGSVYSIKMVTFRVWRHRGESALAASIRHRYTSPSHCVMIWGAIGYTSRSPLGRIDDTLNSACYISVRHHIGGEPIAAMHFCHQVFSLDGDTRDLTMRNGARNLILPRAPRQNTDFRDL